MLFTSALTSFYLFRLHAMMREKIAGELILWNATRFGTIFLFLQSFMDRRDKFEAWMISSDWKNNDWRHEEDHKFTYDCLTSRLWWDNVELVLKAVTPLYSVLRFADQQKNGTISGFIPKMLKAQSDIFATLKHDERVTRSLLDRINEVINRRTRYLLNETLMLAGKNLNDNYSMDFTYHLYPFMNCCCYLLSFSIAELMLFFLILMFFFSHRSGCP